MTSAAVDRGRAVVVDRIRPVADRLVEVLLVAADGARLPRWAPGAHVDLVLPTGLARPYSLAGDPGDDRSWRLLVARSTDGDGAGAYVHDVLRPGDAVRVRGPRHLFPLGGAPRYLFVSSGAGIAPRYPWPDWYAAPASTPGPCCTWTVPAGNALRDEVAGLGAGRPGSGRAPLLQAVSSASPGTAVYACGSSRFVDAVAEPPGPTWICTGSDSTRPPADRRRPALRGRPGPPR